MEKQERIPPIKRRKITKKKGEIKLNLKLNRNLPTNEECIAGIQKHLVCLQIISNMFSLSLVARSTELNLHVILAVVHMC